MRDAEPPTAVERFLMAQVEERDVEIVELKQTVVRLQCQLLHERERQGRGDPGARASPAARWKGAPDQSFLQARKPTLTVEGALSSTSSIESTGDSEAMLEPEAVGPDSFRIRIVSPSSTTVISPDCAAAEKPAAASNPFVSMLLGCAPVQAAVLAYAGSCEALLHVTPVLAEVINTFCVVEVERFKTEFSLEPGIANESPYERLSASLKRRWRLTAARGADAKTGKASRSIDSKSASSSAFLKAYPRMLSNVRLHAFVTSQLRRQLNTIAINVNTTVSDHCLVRGPRGLDPSFNSLVRQRGVNVGATCTQHSSTQPVDATKSFRWLINRDVRLFYPRGPVPHQLEMLRAVKALGIQPKALVLDVCLVKPKWFPAIQYMVDYTTVILVPEVPSRDALEEGEAQKIRAKFNKYLETSATAGQCLHVVLDSALAAELAKEITTSRVNVLSLDLPDKEGPIGFRGHPQIELLTLLDSVFDDSLTLTVPAEREPIARDFFSPAPGAGGVYKYSPSLTFSFGSAQPGAPPARQGGNRRAPAPPGGPRFSMRPRGDDEEGVSDSSSYSQSSQQSAAELPPPFRNPAAAGSRFGRSLARTASEHSISPPRWMRTGSSALRKAQEQDDASSGVPAAGCRPGSPPRAAASRVSDILLPIPGAAACGPEASPGLQTTKVVEQQEGITLAVTSAQPPAPVVVPAAAAGRAKSILAVEHLMVSSEYYVPRSCALAAVGNQFGHDMLLPITEEQRKLLVEGGTLVRTHQPLAAQTMRFVKRALLKLGGSGGGVAVNVATNKWENDGSRYNDALAGAAGEGVEVIMPEQEMHGHRVLLSRCSTPDDLPPDTLLIAITSIPVSNPSIDPRVLQVLRDSNTALFQAPCWIVMGHSTGAQWGQAPDVVTLDGVHLLRGARPTCLSQLKTFLSSSQLVFATRAEVLELIPLLELPVDAADPFSSVVRLVHSLLSPDGSIRGQMVVTLPSGTPVVSNAAGAKTHPFPSVAPGLLVDHACESQRAAFIGGYLSKWLLDKPEAQCVTAGFKSVVASCPRAA